MNYIQLSFVFFLYWQTAFSQDTLMRRRPEWKFVESRYKLKLTETVTDIDNNIYHIQKIGNQIWLIENLRVVHFNNGDTILNKDNNDWISENSPAWFHTLGKIDFKCDSCEQFGNIFIKTDEIFYNQFVVRDSRNVCPIGFHIPDTSEYKELMNAIDRIFFPDSTIKEIKIVPMDRSKSDLYGFQEFPFGYRGSETGEVKMYGSHGYWWTSINGFAVGAWSDPKFGYDLYITYPNWESWNMNSGCSIKCIKDD